MDMDWLSDPESTDWWSSSDKNFTDPDNNDHTTTVNGPASNGNGNGRTPGGSAGSSNTSSGNGGTSSGFVYGHYADDGYGDSSDESYEDRG